MVDFKWDFTEKDFMMAQDSKAEDDIFGWIYVKTEKGNYIVDIHREYYNSKDCGYDLEVYSETADGSHGLWLGSDKRIKSVSAKHKPLEKFKKRAEKDLIGFIINAEQVA